MQFRRGSDRAKRGPVRVAVVVGAYASVAQHWWSKFTD
jgi:hypothetical protein